MRGLNVEIIRDEIQKGLAQVDSDLTIEQFSCAFDSVNRNLVVKFTAVNGSGEAVDINLSY